MGDYNLSLEIKQTGADQALADLDKLSKAGQSIVQRYATATNTSLNAAIAKWGQLGDKAAMEMLRSAVAAEESGTRAVAATDKVTKAIEQGTAAHEPHIAGLSRIGNSLASLVGHATGVPPVLEKIGDAIGVMSIGHLATVGVLAGFAAIAFAYEKITENAKEAAKQAAETMKEFDRIAHLDVQGQGAAAQLLYGGDKSATDPYKVASLKELQRLRAEALQTQKEGTSSFVGALGVTTQTLSEDAKKATENLKALNKEIEHRNDLLHSTMGPGGSFARAAQEMIAADQPGFITDQLKEAERIAKSWFGEQEKIIKGYGLLGQLSGAQAEKLEKEAVQYRAQAAALGEMSVKGQQFLALAKEIDAVVRKSDTQEDTATRAHGFFAKAFGVPETVSPGDSARIGIISSLIPDPKDLAAQLRYAIAIAVDDVKNSPAVQWAATAKQLGDDMGKRLGQGLGQGLTAGFAAAFSGKGVIGFIEGFGDSMLAALGGIFIRQGEALISFSAIMKGLGIALANPITAPFAAAAEGVALIALGAALSAAAHGGGGSSGGGGSVGGGNGSFTTPSYLTFGVQAQSTPTTSLAAPPARPNLTFNVIGNDPKVQRDIAAIVNSATDRGLIGGGRG